MGAIETLRDALFGNPPSPTTEPSREGTLAAFTDLAKTFSTSLAAVTVAKTTKALLDADLAHAADTTAIVYADATDANNDLYIKVGASGAGSWTNTGFLHQTAENLIEPYLSQLRDGIFFSTFADTYIRAIVKWIRIEGGPPGRIYTLNVLSDNAGGTRRLSFFLYDTVRGANVAIWGRQKAYDWTSEVPEVVMLSGAANGSIRGDVDYVGLTCSIGLDTTAISFTHNLTAYTDPADGILPANIWTAEEVRRRIMTGEGLYNHVITVGTDGDFTTTRAAIDSLMLDADPAAVHRGWFPYSDFVTPSNQYTIRYLPGHVEDVPARKAGGIGVGVILWPGLTLELAEDTVLTTDGVADDQVNSPLFEVNYGGRILMPATAKLENTSEEGDVIHIDSGNALTVPSEANASDPTAGTQYFCPTLLCKGGLMEGGERVIAHGIAQGELLVFDGVTFKETAVAGNLAPFVAHDSASSVNPARMEFRDCIFIHPGGGPSIDLIKQNARTTRDELVVNNCDATQVQTTNTTGDGLPGFIRCGRIDVPIVSPDLNP